MRLDYSISIQDVAIPRFSVEAVEGISKLFTLATLVLNLLETKDRIEIVFHGLNPEDPERKIRGFQEIVTSSGSEKTLQFETRQGGRVAGSSSYFQWIGVSAS